MIDKTFLEARGVTVPRFPFPGLRGHLQAARINRRRFDLLAEEAAWTPADFELVIRHLRIPIGHSTVGRALDRIGTTKTIPPGRSVAVRGYRARRSLRRNPLTQAR
jgi:hypothetical protein